MALSDMFASSIAGINSGLSLLQSSVQTLSNPAVWGTIPEPPAFTSVFQEILTEKVANLTQPGSGRTGGDQGGGLVQTEVSALIPVTPPDLVPLPGPDLVGTLMDMLVAEKMIEANARLISSQSKEMGTLLHLGE